MVGSHLFPSAEALSSQHHLPFLGRNKPLPAVRDEPEKGLLGLGFESPSPAGGQHCLRNCIFLLEHPSLMALLCCIPAALTVVINENPSWGIVSDTPSTGRTRGDKTIYICPFVSLSSFSNVSHHYEPDSWGEFSQNPAQTSISARGEKKIKKESYGFLLWPNISVCTRGNIPS